MKRTFYAVAILFLLNSLPLAAQVMPASSNAIFCFPHLADGGPDSSKWITVFRIVNPDMIVALPVSGTLWFYDTRGNPLALDFGNGGVTSLNLTLPANGAVQLKTTGSSPTLRTGTVWGSFDSPVLAVEEFQNLRNGAFLNGASVNASGLTSYFQTYADRYTGIALTNPYSNTIYCNGNFRDSGGNVVGSKSIPLAPQSQTSFNIGNLYNVSGSTPGSFSLNCNWQADAPDTAELASFVALAIAGDSRGMTSSMPPGHYALPTDRMGIINNGFRLLVRGFNAVGISVG